MQALGEDHRGTVWKMAQDLGLEQNEVAEWRKYINQLGNNFILLTEDKDKLIWTWNKNDAKFSAKLGYEAMVQLEYQQTECWRWSRTWKLQASLKAILILWLAMNNKLLTWEALLKHGFMGPGIFLLCRVEGEICAHLFF